MKKLAKTIVLLSTHIVSDVSNLCSHFAVIRSGKILAATSPDAALAKLEGRLWEATVPREQVAALKGRGKVISTQMVGGRTRVRHLNANLNNLDFSVQPLGSLCLCG